MAFIEHCKRIKVLSLIVLFVFISNFSLLLCEFQCPTMSSIYPCNCSIDFENSNFSQIQCFNIKDENFKLRNIFEEISKVNDDDSSVDVVWINDTTIDSIYPEDFAGFNVRYGKDTKLEISYNFNLSFIDPYAFHGFNPYIVRISYNPALSENALEAVKELKNASEYLIIGNGIESIPEGSFSELKSVNVLFLSYNKINRINTRAFDMVHEIGYDQIDYKISLSYNQLHSNSFELGAFDGLNITTNNRPICWEINLANNNISYLNESIFAPFLDTACQDPYYGNSLNLLNNPFMCGCRMKWLMDGKERYRKLVWLLYCSNDNDRDFWSYNAEDFESCEHQSSSIEPGLSSISTVETTTEADSGSYQKNFLNIYTLVCLFSYQMFTRL